MTKTRIIIAILLFSASVTAAIVGSFLVTIIKGEINRKLPEQLQIKYFSWYPGGLSALKKNYKEFYPDGKLALALKICIALHITFLVLFVFAFGFFG